MGTSPRHSKRKQSLKATAQSGKFITEGWSASRVTGDLKAKTKRRLERATGLEPATSTSARWRSASELRPLFPQRASVSIARFAQIF